MRDVPQAGGRPASEGSELATDSGNAVRRVAAAVIDLGFLGAINAAVVWFTLRQCDLTWQQAQVLPIAPMAAFLALVTVGYLFLFKAASGKTIGKMLDGLRGFRACRVNDGHHVVRVMAGGFLVE